MSIDLPCPSSSSSCDDHDHHHISLYSQPSLPSVPSLQLPAAAAAIAAVAVVPGHSSYVSSLVLSGKALFSSSSDGTVRVWSRGLRSRRLVVASAAAVKAVVVSGDRLFTAHHDHKIRVWRLRHDSDAAADYDDDDEDSTGGRDGLYRCIATMPTLSDRVSRIFLARNYVRVRRNKPPRTWVHHNDAVSALAVSTDGSVLYSASWDRSIKLWRASDFRCLQSIPDAHDDAVNALAAAPGGRLYSGSADRRIRAWAPAAQSRPGLAPAQTLEKHRSAVNALAVSPDGGVLYSGACDRSVLVWERGGSGEMAVVGALRGHGGAILSLGVAGDLVCSGSADCSVRVWKRTGLDNKSYACLGVLEGHRRPVKCLSLVLDNSEPNNNNSNGCSYLVYSGGLDCEIRVWKLRVSS